MIPALMARALVGAGSVPASPMERVWYNPKNGEGCPIGDVLCKTQTWHRG